MAGPSFVTPVRVLPLASGLLAAALTVLALRYRDEIGAEWFATLLGFVALWDALVVVSAFVPTARGALVIDYTTTVLSISVPVIWFLFVVEYTGWGDRLTRPRLVALWVVPAVGYLLILTSPLHAVYFRSVELTVTDGVPVVVTPAGPGTYAVVAYLFGLFLVGGWLVVRMLWEHEGFFSGQAVWLLLGTLAPVVAGGLQVLATLPESAPAVPIGLTVSGLAYGYGLFRHRLLDMTPASRRIGAEEAFDSLSEGVVITDNDWSVLNVNASACKQFDCQKPAVLGASIDAVDDRLRSDPGSTQEFASEGRLLECTTSRVLDSREKRAGYVVVVRDVTEQHGRKQRLTVLNRLLRHNLRNDMTVIRGYASEIARRDDEAADLAASIEATADDLIDMAEKARAIERTITTDETVRREVDLATFLDPLLTDLRTRYPDVAVRTDVPPDLAVETEPATLELVVGNLLENACDHGVPPASADDAHGGVGRESGSIENASDVTNAGQNGPRGGDGHLGEGDGHPEGGDADDGTDRIGEPPRSESPRGGPDRPADRGRSEPLPSETPPGDLPGPGTTEDGADGGPADGADDHPGDERGPSPGSGLFPPGDACDVVLRARRDGDDVVLTVGDRGPGVPEAELEVIRRGTETALEHCSGIGLWLVHWGVTRLGGDLAFDVADGTVVTLRLVGAVPDDQSAAE